MPDPRGRLATLIVTIVLLTLLVAFSSASLVIWLVADWARYGSGLTLTLKIMWGSWLVLFVAGLLTYATIMGWRFRKARPDQGPPALLQAVAAGVTPSAWLKTGPTSFTITVVLVSLLGVAVLSSVIIWIIGDWKESRDALWLTVKFIWGTWWVLCIITVLVRVTIFAAQRRRAGYSRKHKVEIDEQDAAEDPHRSESTTGNAP